jgi:type IV pilus assembly protein PilF
VKLRRVSGVLLVAALLHGCAGSSPREALPPDAVRDPGPGQQPGAPVERARAHTELGASYLQIARLGVALQELEEAIKADPGYVPAHTTLGLVHMQLRQDVEAKASFERALKLDPKNPDANNNYGLFLCDRNRAREGIRYFLAALGNPLYETPEDAYVNAGICSRRIGDDAAALGYFESALQVRPGERRALVNLASLQLDRGQAAVARSYMARFMKVNPDPDAASLWLAARIEHALGDRAGVATYGQQLRARFPEARETSLFNESRFK